MGDKGAKLKDKRNIEEIGEIRDTLTEPPLNY